MNATSKSKLSEEVPTYQQSLTFVRNLIRTAISSICYIRGLFDDKHFVDKNLCGINIKALTPIDEHAKLLTQWIEHGVFDALQKKFLKMIIFGICVDPEKESSLLESYNFTITYPTQNEICVSFGDSKNGSVIPTKDNIKQATTTLLRRLICLTQTFPPLPDQRYMMMKLHYYTDRTPLEYSPQFFKTQLSQPVVYQYTPTETPIGEINTTHHTIDLKVFSSTDAYLEKSALAGREIDSQEENNVKQQNMYIKNFSKKEYDVPLDSQETYMEENSQIYSQLSTNMSQSKKRLYSDYEDCTNYLPNKKVHAM